MEAAPFSERVALLRLARSDNVGPATVRDLLARFRTAEAALEAVPALAARGGRRGAIRLASREAAEAELDALEDMGGTLLTLADPAYPRRLAAIDGAPTVLSVAGDVASLSRPAVAIVGSRNASLSGRKTAEALARDLGRAGLVIVSGLARGIDGAAHAAALETGTVAVMAGGLDRVYPPEHADLAARMVEAGWAVVTEMPLGWQARSVDFPRRNRIVSGLSLAVVVVEAARRSGTVHTARHALDQGRDVFAVPGSPRDPRAEGCNALIKEGAGLVTEAADVLSALDWQDGAAHAGPPVPAGLSEAALSPPVPGEASPDGPDGAAHDPTAGERVLSALSAAPASLDEIVRHTGLPVGAVQLAVLELELAGRIERHAGGRLSLLV